MFTFNEPVVRGQRAPLNGRLDNECGPHGPLLQTTNGTGYGRRSHQLDHWSHYFCRSDHWSHQLCGATESSLYIHPPSNRGAFANEDDKLLPFSKKTSRVPTRYFRRKQVGKIVGPFVGGVYCHRFHGQCSGILVTSSQPHAPTTPPDTHTSLLLSLCHRLCLSCPSLFFPSPCIFVSLRVESQ